MSRQKQIAFSVWVGLAALSVYVATLATDLTWAHNGADGGDLIATSYMGGAAHPPGYPLYSLLGRVVAVLPMGSIPFRYNLFSALAAAGAAALVAWAVAESGLAPALAAGLALAFAPLVWSQAVITEVYALAALLAALTVAQSLRSEPHPLILGVALGLSLCHHPTLIALAPLALSAFIDWAKDRGARTVIVHAAAGGMIGLLPLAYLPLTASAAVGWGDASTPQGFWWLVSAQLYRGYAFALPAAWIGQRVAAIARLLADSFTWIGVLVGLWGCVTLWEHNRWHGIASLVSSLLLVVFAVGYNTADSEVYLIPALVTFAVWIGLGWGDLLSRLSEGPSHKKWARVMTWLVVALMLAPSVFNLVRNGAAQDLHADRVAREFVDGVLAEAPARAIVVTTEDRYTFSLWVGLFVERKRADLAVVDQDLLGYGWYNARLQYGFPGLVTSGAQDVEQLARLNPDRPVCRLSQTPLPWLSCEEP